MHQRETAFIIAARALSSKICDRSQRTREMREDWPVSAVKLVDDLAGASPASASFPVGTVVISGDGAGDQAVGSPEVNVLGGWMRFWSAPNRRASKAAGRSASEP